MASLEAVEAVEASSVVRKAADVVSVVSVVVVPGCIALDEPIRALVVVVVVCMGILLKAVTLRIRNALRLK